MSYIGSRGALGACCSSCERSAGLGSIADAIRRAAQATHATPQPASPTRSKPQAASKAAVPTVGWGSLTQRISGATAAVAASARVEPPAADSGYPSDVYASAVPAPSAGGSKLLLLAAVAGVGVYFATRKRKRGL